MASIHDTPVHAGLRFTANASAYVPSVARSPLVARRGLQPELTVQVLRTGQERQGIAHLREYADFRSEYQLDPGLAAFESIKDEVGIVMALCLDDAPIATIRFVPCGHGITMTERFWRHLVTSPDILGPTSWEVGRLVMAPENRQSDLLPQCLALAGLELLRQREVEHLHASCLMSMTRLYRRFGYKVHCVRTEGGKDCALIHGTAANISERLRLPNGPAERMADMSAPSATHQLLQ